MKCAQCGRASSDTSTLCARCSKQLGSDLRRLAGLWPTLTEAVTRQTRMGNGGRPGQGAAAPLPVDMHASATADRVRLVLHGWVRVIAEDNRLDLPADTVPAMCRWLDGHRRSIRIHEAAADLSAETHAALASVLQAVDYPQDKARHPVGPCPEVLDDAPCPGVVLAHMPHDEPAIWLECPKCGAVWESTQLVRLGARINQRRAQVDRQKTWGRKPAAPAMPEHGPLMGLNLAAVLYGVPPGTLRRWLAQGVLTRHGSARPWLVDVVEVERLRATRRIASGG